jgi:hypothetical protein
MSSKKQPIFTGVIFCNSASKDNSRKINCRDVFTSFLAWAYPTSVRQWYAILTLHNLPDGITSISADISQGQNEKHTLVSANVEKARPDVGNVIVLPLRYKFTTDGLYMVHFNIQGMNISTDAPLRIITQKWPKFSKKQLDFLKINNSIPHSIRINVNCAECSRPYVFEESAFSQKSLTGGVLPFPQTGTFKCDSCSHKLDLMDIQGQLRSSLKNAVIGAMKGRN